MKKNKDLFSFLPLREKVIRKFFECGDVALALKDQDEKEFEKFSSQMIESHTPMFEDASLCRRGDILVLYPRNASKDEKSFYLVAEYTLDYKVLVFDCEWENCELKISTMQMKKWDGFWRMYG